MRRALSKYVNRIGFVAKEAITRFVDHATGEYLNADEENVVRFMRQCRYESKQYDGRAENQFHVEFLQTKTDASVNDWNQIDGNDFDKI